MVYKWRGLVAPRREQELVHVEEAKALRELPVAAQAARVVGVLPAQVPVHESLAGAPGPGAWTEP